MATGVVESYMSSGSTGYDTKTYEHLKFFADTQAWLPKNAVVANKKAFDALDKPTQDGLLKAAAEAEVMVSQKVAEFTDWQKSRQSVPLIRALRDEGERARRQVLENAMKQLAKGTPPEEVLERLSVQLTNKLLHSPTRTLNKAGANDSDLVEAVAQIYHLEHPE